MSDNDWIKISIRYSGPCVKCKKKLESGSYGYWSRSSKSILHEKCFEDMDSFSSNKIKMTDSDTDIEFIKNVQNNKCMTTKDLLLKNSQQSIGLMSKSIKKNERKNKCYICNNVIDLKDELISSLLTIADKFLYKVDVFYCHNCLENFNKSDMEKYSQKFMNQV